MAALPYRQEETPNEVEDPEKRVAAGRERGREGEREGGREGGRERERERKGRGPEDRMIGGRIRTSMICTCSCKLTSYY